MQHLEGELAQLHQTYVSILCKVLGMHKTGQELLFTKPTDVLLQDFVKSRSREIRVIRLSNKQYSRARVLPETTISCDNILNNVV